MTDNVILALDLAKQLGFCVGKPGHKPTMGSVSLKTRSLHEGAKFCVLVDWLAPMIKEHRPFRIIYEAPLMMMPKGKNGKGGGNAFTMAALIGYANIVDMMAHRWGIEVVKSASSTARKHFIGNGRHPDAKPEVMRECQRRGWDPIDNNASDAAALWDMACKMYYPTLYTRSYPGAVPYDPRTGEIL